MTQKPVIISLFGVFFMILGHVILPAQTVFEQNIGQWEPHVLYTGSGSGSTVSFMDNELSFVVGREMEGSSSSDEDEDHPNLGDPFEYLVWNLEFGNAQPCNLIPEGTQPGKSNYFTNSDASRGYLHVPEAQSLLYKEVYPGIDARYYREGVRLKYDFLLDPGANPAAIQLIYKGIEGLALTPRGRLEVETDWGTRSEEQPFAFQEINGQQVPVACEYTLYNDTTYGFALGTYDPAYPLVIDPLVLIWSTFAGATVNSSNNYAYDVAVDNQGFVYVCGKCDGSFPTTPSAYDTNTAIGQEVAFIRKYTPDGSSLVYSTYLGTPTAAAWSLAVNDLGQVYVTGMTGAAFPLTPGSYLSIPFGSVSLDVFLTKLNAAGDGLIYSTRFGGAGSDLARSVAINASGEAYLTGFTPSGDFPTTAGAFATGLSGANDAFVFKMNAAGTAPVYSTYLGAVNSNGVEEGNEIVVDRAGNAVLVGNTLGGTGNTFPTTPGAWQPTTLGSTEGFVAKLNGNGSALSHCTLLGRSAGETAHSLQLNSRDEPYVTGWTSSTTFPVSPNAVQTTYAGVADAYVVHFSATLDTTLRSTIWGGLASDEPYDIALINDSEPVIFGFSQAAGMQTDSCAFQPAHQQGADFFMAHFNADLTALGAAGSTYFGGMSSDYHRPSVVADTTSSETYLVFAGTSHSTDFTTTPGSYQPAKLNQTGDQPVTFKMQVVDPRFYDSLVCQFDTVRLDPGPGALSYAWVTGDSSQSIQVTGPGDYWAALTYHSCTIRDTFSLGIGAAVVLGDDQVGCDLDSAILAATNGPFTGFSHLWSTGATNPQITVQNSGAYWLEVSDSLGCTGRDTLNVYFGATPPIGLPPDTAFCGGGQLTVDARLGPQPVDTRYLWSTGDTVPIITLSTDTTYWVQAWDSLGCVATDTIEITVFPLPVLSLPDSSSGCDGDAVLLNADPNNAYPGGTFTWNTGDTGLTISVTTSGTYSVDLIDGNGCPAEDSVVLTFFPYPSLDLGPNLDRCEPIAPVVWDADPTNQYPGAQFLWSDQSTGAQLTVGQSGIWWVDLIGEGGCLVSDTVSLTVHPIPMLELGNSPVLCEGDSAELVPVADPGLDYTWSTGATAPAIWVQTPGTFSLEVISAAGCVASDSVEMALIPRFVLELGPDIEQCFVEEILLDPSLSGIDLEWSTGSQETVITVDESGIYWVVAENECQLEQDTVSIEFLTDRSWPYIPSAFTPNGDDLNEEFSVTWGDPERSSYELRIYNRWGVLIFHSFDPDQAWDGTYDGAPVQEGVYVYRFFAEDCEGKQFEKVGSITLLR